MIKEENIWNNIPIIQAQPICIGRRKTQLQIGRLVKYQPIWSMVTATIVSFEAFGHRHLDRNLLFKKKKIESTFYFMILCTQIHAQKNILNYLLLYQ